MTINVLGTEYTVTVKKYDEDETFKHYGANGYCSYTGKKIVLCDMSTFPDWEHETDRARENQRKATLRHEIIHAFLGESDPSAAPANVYNCRCTLIAEVEGVDTSDALRRDRWGSLPNMTFAQWENHKRGEGYLQR